MAEVDRRFPGFHPLTLGMNVYNVSNLYEKGLSLRVELSVILLGA
jgi:hypothetical protein